MSFKTLQWCRILMAGVCRLYPRDFRLQLGADMAGVFDNEVRRRREVSGWLHATGYAVRTLGAGIFGACRMRLERLTSYGRRSTAKRPTGLFQSMMQDGRYAIRGMAKSPGFTAIAILSLALGIGANTAIFSVVNAVLLRPLPYPQPEQLVQLWETNPSLDLDRSGVAGPTFLDWRERARSFQSLALAEDGTGTLTGYEHPVQIPAFRVTTGFLRTIGLAVAYGRDFLPEEAFGGRQNVAVVTAGFAERFLGGPASAVGKSMTVDGLSYEVVGVLGVDARFSEPVDILVPWDEDELRGQSHTYEWYSVIGRLHPGVTVEQAQSELDGITAQLSAEYAEMEGWHGAVTSLPEEATAEIRPALMVLLGSALCVLLIACANVANLLLARGSRRQQELALRAALGASRRRLVSQLVVESLLLAIAGGTVGLLLGVSFQSALVRLLPEWVPNAAAAGELFELGGKPAAAVLVFTGVVALVSGVLFGLVPALKLSMARLTSVIAHSARGLTSPHRTQSLLVVAEVGAAAILLVGTTLLLQTSWNLARIDPGFTPDGMLTARIELPTDTKYQTMEERIAFYQEVLGLLEETPGVDAAGIGEILPLDHSPRHTSVSIRGDAAASLSDVRGTDYNLASEGFFRTMQIPLLRGRLFDNRDRVGNALTTIVDATFVNRYLSGRDPIGKHIQLWDGSEWEVIGVVGSVRSAGLVQNTAPTVYVNYLQVSDNQMTLVVRGKTPETDLLTAIENAVWQVDANQPIHAVRMMDQLVERDTSSTSATMILLTLFGGVALLMAALGVYGVMSFTVGRRTREMGIRSAFGAAGGNIIGMVLRDSLFLAVPGVILGLLGALLLRRLLSSLLYGVSPNQPMALVSVSVTIMLVAIAAAWLPARRASRVDPMVALRAE